MKIKFILSFKKMSFAIYLLSYDHLMAISIFLVYSKSNGHETHHKRPYANAPNN